MTRFCGRKFGRRTTCRSECPACANTGDGCSLRWYVQRALKYMSCLFLQSVDVAAAHLPHVRHADDVRRADERLDFEAALAQHVTKQRRRGAAFEGAAGSERQSRLERLVTSSALVTLLGEHHVEVESNDS